MPSPNHIEIVNYTQKSADWWTPPWLIALCRTALGGHIDLDPASCPEANRYIQADKIYTKQDNGLAQPWTARTLFLNPPSQKDDPLAQPMLWAERLDLFHANGMVGAATLIVKSNLGYNWYENLYQRYWVCHLRKLPSFLLDGVYRPDKKAKKGVSIFFMGIPPSLLYDLFSPHGRVVPPETWVDNRI